MKETRAILAAILAAVLYALMTPLAKLMQVNVGPVAEAGLLYLFAPGDIFYSLPAGAI